MKFLANLFTHDSSVSRREISIRPLSLDDLAAYEAFIASLSAQTRRQRLLGGAVNPSAELLAHALSPKRPLEQVLGAFSDAQRSMLIGVGRFAQSALVDGLPKKLRRAKCAEFALTIADDWHSQGVGKRLLLALMQQANRAHYRYMIGTVLVDNEAMLNLARQQGFQVVPVSGEAELCTLYRCLESVLEVSPSSTLLNSPTPSMTPIINKTIPVKLSQPGKV